MRAVPVRNHFGTLGGGRVRLRARSPGLAFKRHRGVCIVDDDRLPAKKGGVVRARDHGVVYRRAEEVEEGDVVEAVRHCWRLVPLSVRRRVWVAVAVCSLRLVVNYHGESFCVGSSGWWRISYKCEGGAWNIGRDSALL